MLRTRSPPTARSSGVDEQPAGPVVLLVDDDEGIRRTVGAGLELEGFTVVPASGGKPALEAAERIEPDVVLLDLSMPDLDGLEVLRRLRERGDEVPVCVLSARDEGDDRVPGLQAGADDYGVQPLALEEVAAGARGAGGAGGGGRARARPGPAAGRGGGGGGRRGGAAGRPDGGGGGRGGAGRGPRAAGAPCVGGALSPRPAVSSSCSGCSCA